MKKFFEKVQSKGVLIATGVAATGVPVFAAEGGASATDTLKTTLEGVAADSVSAVGVIAGIALSIFAAKFVWTWGIGFFSKLARK